MLRVLCPGPLGCCSPVGPLGALLCVCAVLGHLAPVHRCARVICCLVSAVSWATWLLCTGVPAGRAVLRVRCPGPLGSCSPLCPLSALLCVCGVLGHLAPVHRCAGVVCCVASAVSWATWPLFSGAPARCVALLVRCPGPLGSCSPVCLLGVLCCMGGVLNHLAPVHRRARCILCFSCAVSWATWLLFTGVPAGCVVLRVRCPGPGRSCLLVCPLCTLLCWCGVLGQLPHVHRCARSVCLVGCAVSWATLPLFASVRAPYFALLVRCPGPLGSCSPVCLLRPLLCLCGVLGDLAPVHRCARLVCCIACAVSWATWLLFPGVPALCVVLRVRCPRPLDPCSPVRPLGVSCCVYGVLCPLALVHGCARSVCCVGCAVSWATWLLFTGVLARCVVLWVACACCLCGAPLQGAHSSIRTGAVRSRQGLGTLWARTRPSGQRLFRSWQGQCLLPGAHSFVRTPAGVAWHLFSCCGSLRVVRARWVCGTRHPLLLGTSPRALVVAGGVTLWRASWPRLVCCPSSSQVALSAPVGFPDAVVPFSTPGACAPVFTGRLRGARGGRQGTRLTVPAAGSRRDRGAGLVLRRTRLEPRDGVVPGGSLRRRSWAACAAVVGVCGPGH